MGKSGSAKTLTSLAVEDYGDFVQSNAIILQLAIARAAWLARRPRF